MPDVSPDTVVDTLASFFSRDVEFTKRIPDAVLGNPEVCRTFKLCGIRNISDMLLQSIIIKTVGTPGSRLFTFQRGFGIQPVIDTCPRDTISAFSLSFTASVIDEIKHAFA